MIGQILGHYRIVEKIGAGGMGEVYRAHDEQLDRDVALKVLPTGTLADDAARKQFRKEALALAKLNHPNIETVHEFSTQDGVDFLAMELISGHPLSERLKEGPLPEKESLRLGLQFTEGLAAAHAQGVVHRDLKPSNLMITTDGRLKILDFGVAKLLHPTQEVDLTQSITAGTGAVSGTVPYMAPEQLRGRVVDARSDIYAAGVVLYEMATGQRPFAHQTGTALVDDILHKPPPPPGRLRPDLSSRLEEIILKCLEKEPEDRYQSVNELMVDLRRVEAPRTTSTVEEPAGSRGRFHRSKVLAGVGALALLGMVAGIGVWRGWWFGRPAPPRIESLAVLPLENLSHDPEQDYFADGMTEELITNLAKVHGLRVISRTSVMQYRGTKKPLREIGRELNVNAVVEGSVLRSENRVRITAQLIRADTDTHLWAESYDRELRDVLSLQNEVARAITNEIRLELTPQEQQRLAATRPVNFDAYQDYLQGRYFWNKRDPASIKRAVDYFEQAIQKDPNYALPYAGLGDSYQFLIGLPDQEAFAKSTAAYTKAAELDSSLAEPHAGLGLLLFSNNYQWANSEQEFRRAIELNPGYASAHQWYSNLLAILGRKEEAKAEILKALELDPLSPIINTTLGYRLAEDERYDDAIAQFRKVLEINPNFLWAHSALGEAHLKKGMFKEGIAELRTKQILLGYKSDKVDRDAEALSEAYARAGPHGYWQKRLELAMAEFKLRGLAEPSEISRYEIASYHARLGQKDQALQWLNQSYAARESDLGTIKIDPVFKDLRSDPRFQDLLRSIGLPQ